MRCIGNCEVCARCRKDVSVKGKIAESLPEWFKAEYADKKAYGISIDLGTTTVAVSLWDLENARFVMGKSEVNPQSKYGADVISRIMYTLKNKNDVLHNEIIKCLNNIINEVVLKAGIKKDDVVKMSLCGNTVMSHLFANKPIDGLAKAPFKPYFYEMSPFYADEIGLDLKCKVFVMPNIGSFVGSDTASAILASGILKEEKACLLVDIGTNGEIALYNNGKILVASTAAGPAFEGGGIKCGMKAGKGAIEGVRFEKGDIFLEIIGDCEPIGICGSGIIDCIAKFCILGIIDKSGRIISKEEAREKNISEKIVRRIKESYIIIYDDIVITQEDIREFQLAKGALYAGIMALLNEEKISFVENIFIAGAFGSFINKKSAIAVKMIPNNGKISVIGNAALIGASMVLISEEAKREVCKIAKKATHIELSENDFFNNNYINMLEF